jgi:hypothetical protein
MPLARSTVAGLFAAIVLPLTASAARPVATTPVAAPAPAPATAPAADREAILAMAGAFRVQFTFRETVPLSPGYEPRAAYQTDAVELVEVIEDRGGFISLQHVLLVGAEGPRPTVVKHWRQDWTFEDGDLLEFAGEDRWVRRRLDAGTVRGTWSQAVYQTTDAPRYESIGRWTHEAGRSAWESQETWRPLPRREHTTREDYHVLVSRNRHVITPEGWVHEQDSRKLVLDAAGRPERHLVHETGLNRYVRCDPALLAPATDYWQQHAAAWSEVRAAWNRVLDRPEVTLDPDAGGPPLDRLIEVALQRPEVRRDLARRLEERLAG